MGIAEIKKKYVTVSMELRAGVFRKRWGGKHNGKRGGAAQGAAMEQAQRQARSNLVCGGPTYRPMLLGAGSQDRWAQAGSRGP